MFNSEIDRLTAASRLIIAGAVVLRWLGICATLAIYLAIAWLLERLAIGAASPYDLIWICILAVLGLLARAVCLFVATRLSHKAGAATKTSLRVQIFDAVHSLGATYNRDISTAEVVQLAVEGVDHLEVYAGRYLPQLYYACVAPVTVFICLLFVDIPTSLILLVAAILIPVSLVAIQTVARRRVSGYWNRYTDLGAAFLENLQGLVTLKVFACDEQRHQDMNASAERFRVATMRVLKMQLGSVSVMDLLTFGGSAAGIIVAASRFGAGSMGLGSCLLVMMLAGEFLVPLRQLGSLFHVSTTGMTTGKRIANLLALAQAKQNHSENLPNDLQSNVRLNDQPCGCYGGLADARDTESATLSNNVDNDISNNISKDPGCVGSISLQNVGFSYDEQRFALRDITIDFKTGLSAIVGSSGCGKSSLASVLAGNNIGYSGSIRLNGVELSDMTVGERTAIVTLTAHNSYIFSGTVRENLLMGCASSSDEQLMLALDQVGLTSELTEIGFGLALDVLLKEGGSNLSGGQRQRLAIARALLRDTPVYIFDEALSNIDPENEQHICELIANLAQEHTVIMISHRLASVVSANVIYCMANGIVKEQGSHQSLLAMDASYANMFNEQQELERCRV